MNLVVLFSVCVWGYTDHFTKLLELLKKFYFEIYSVLILNRWIIEFYLNNFPWIQWIMTKSKNSMVTRGITHLATDIFSVLVQVGNA